MVEDNFLLTEISYSIILA